MADRLETLTRRQVLRGACSAASACCLAGASPVLAGASGSAAEQASRALIAITLDLEMSRHYPVWEQTHWDYEKGNLDDATKRYAVEVARRVKDRGSIVHFFSVGRTLEQQDVEWLR